MLGTLAFLGLPIIGIALLWAVHLIYAGRQTGRDEPLQFVLVTIAWMLIVAGLIAPMVASMIGMLLIVATCVILLMATVQYRASERRALLWMLGASAARGLPLDLAARAFAAERSDAVGREAIRLAEQLEAGIALPDALRASGTRLPPDAQLAARLAYETGGIDAGLLETARLGASRERDWRPLFEKMLYLVVLSFITIGILTFIMLKIVPAFDKIFRDFDTELPAMTQLVITFSAWAFKLAPLWIMLNPLLTFLLIFGAIAYITLPTWDFQRIPYGVQSLWSLPRLIFIFWLNLFFLPFRPLAMWMMKPYHRATILDALARCVEGQHALVPSLALLAQWYPQPAIRRRLTVAHDQAAAGVDWCEALVGRRLIARGDAAVLRAAQRAGNLPWALRETAARGWRRVQTRTAVLNNVVLPLCVLAMAMGIAFLVIGLFLPLIKLIQTLA